MPIVGWQIDKKNTVYLEFILYPNASELIQVDALFNIRFSFYPRLW